MTIDHAVFIWFHSPRMDTHTANTSIANESVGREEGVVAILVHVAFTDLLHLLQEARSRLNVWHEILQDQHCNIVFLFSFTLLNCGYKYHREQCVSPVQSHSVGRCILLLQTLSRQS